MCVHVCVFAVERFHNHAITSLFTMYFDLIPLILYGTLDSDLYSVGTVIGNTSDTFLSARDDILVNWS